MTKASASRSGHPCKDGWQVCIPSRTVHKDVCESCVFSFKSHAICTLFRSPTVKATLQHITLHPRISTARARTAHFWQTLSLKQLYTSTGETARAVPLSKRANDLRRLCDTRRIQNNKVKWTFKSNSRTLRRARGAAFTAA